MLRVVIDTNVFISFIFNKRSRRLAQRWTEGDFELLASPAILREYRTILKIFARIRPELSAEMLQAIETKAALVNVGRKPRLIKEDPSDDKFLQCAIEGGADYLISTDRHILKQKGLHRVKIVKPAEFMSVLGDGN